MSHGGLTVCSSVQSFPRWVPRGHGGRVPLPPTPPHPRERPRCPGVASPGSAWGCRFRNKARPVPLTQCVASGGRALGRNSGLDAVTGAEPAMGSGPSEGKEEPPDPRPLLCKARQEGVRLGQEPSLKPPGLDVSSPRSARCDVCGLSPHRWHLVPVAGADGLELLLSWFRGPGLRQEKRF